MPYVNAVQRILEADNSSDVDMSTIEVGKLSYLQICDALEKKQKQIERKRRRAQRDKKQQDEPLPEEKNEVEIENDEMEIDHREEDKIFRFRLSNRLFSSMMIAEFCGVFFAMLGLIINVIAKELQFAPLEKELFDPYNNTVRENIEPSEESVTKIVTDYINTFCNFCIVASIYVRYDIWLRWS
mmetsp:Transcript_17666/g.27349  ORF Transcript_17666/g.27349 Transcript_17666/m.27349 type:complete len:184 (-) Transcript_17666:1250-1801(-)